MTDPQFTFEILVILTITMVAAGLYFETEALIRYLIRTAGIPDFRITRVRRLASSAYSALFIMTILILLIFYLLSPDNAWIFSGLTALIIGFGIHGLLYQICFINPMGLGQVSLKMEMEIPWDAITDYRWEQNVLYLKLKNRKYFQPVFRFSDSAAILAVNEFLVSRVGGGRILPDSDLSRDEMDD